MGTCCLYLKHWIFSAAGSGDWDTEMFMCDKVLFIKNEWLMCIYLNKGVVNVPFLRSFIFLKVTYSLLMLNILSTVLGSDYCQQLYIDSSTSDGPGIMSGDALELDL